MQMWCMPDELEVLEPSAALGSLTFSLPLLSLVSSVHCSCQVPHLDAAVAMTSEQVAPGSRSHPARSLTLTHHETGDGCPVYWLHFTNPDKKRTLACSSRQADPKTGERWLYLFPVDDSLTNSLLVMGMTFCMNTCWSSLSPNGPEPRKERKRFHTAASWFISVFILKHSTPAPSPISFPEQ